MLYRSSVMSVTLVLSICCYADAAKVSGMIKSLKGNPLTITELNVVRADAGLPAMTADEFRLSLRIAASPRGETSSVGTITFNSGSGVFTIDVPTVDPNDKRINIRLSAPGLLQPVILEGVSIETQSINVIMPLQRCGGCGR